ncbi:MAG: bifunctional anthranilate synthase component II/anthranilate phosphoribosyltransferase [Anaerolineae bacterium]
MIAVIDNYDSFTYNLVQYLGELGASCRVYRNDAVTVEELEQLAPSHIVISPGPGTPAADGGVSNDVVRAFHGRVPILGVCLGHQCIAHTFGARVDCAERLMHGKVSRVMHQGDPLFEGVPAAFEATRYHSLAVYEPLPEALQVIARTAEGEVMALRHRDAWTVGVQFHPESILTPHGKRLLANFMRATVSGTYGESSAGEGTTQGVADLDLPAALERALDREHLTTDEAERVMMRIMSGQATPAQIGAYLAALRAKGETVPEIAGFARAMRNHVVRVQPSRRPLVDTCGTGGDGGGTFNISTAAAFVVAGAGVAVAKHGNRSVSSKCGSADVLTALGVELDLAPEDVASCIDEVGFGFLYAPALHPAMKHAIGPRREMKVRTVFNVLGPLTNPAGASVQLLGVYSRDLVSPLAHVLRELGSDAACVVSSADGLDELTTTAPNHLAVLAGGQVEQRMLDATDLGLPRVGRQAIAGGDPAENAVIIRGILAGEQGPRREVVLLNAGMALVAAGVAMDAREGLERAAESIDSGRAASVLDELVAYTRREVAA